MEYMDNFFNFSLGYRRDSPTSSPYGYTVKLAVRSQNDTRIPSEKRLSGKHKPLAWFVSNCGTNSFREQYVAALQVRRYSFLMRYLCRCVK